MTSDALIIANASVPVRNPSQSTLGFGYNGNDDLPATKREDDLRVDGTFCYPGDGSGKNIPSTDLHPSASIRRLPTRGTCSRYRQDTRNSCNQTHEGLAMLVLNLDVSWRVQVKELIEFSRYPRKAGREL
jgi:hypothetical protein